VNESHASGSPAVFLDRDGVINEEGPGYVTRWSEFFFLPGALEGIRLLHRRGFRIFVVTNQSCVGRGLIRASDLETIHSLMRDRIQNAGGWIEQVYMCPCLPDSGCLCRKPLPGMILQAARDYGLNLKHAVLVGDALTDIQAGKAAGCRTFLVRTGKGIETLEQLRRGALPEPDCVTENLLEAAHIITRLPEPTP